MNRDMFDAYAERLERHGIKGVGNPAFELGREGKYSLRYIPFEYVNKDARLVIVGITPGNTQLEIAYQTAQSRLRTGKDKTNTLIEIKKNGAFGGDMRKNLVKMLNHFKLDRILGIHDINELWNSQAHLLHSTSVVPHAAYEVKKGQDAMFNGSFGEVMKSPLLKDCFLKCFIPSIQEMNPEALYIGLGVCPTDALNWCVEQGYIRAEQMLGSLSHPSSNGGNSVPYFLREKRLEDLKPKDPIRYRADWLDAAHDNLKANSDRLVEKIRGF
ncbi:hypothetical protein IVG45_17190 [Methylomonas sp. LL1]|uniref:hypothetical protein n=1 Tax=Methylomonas sp. LL1 TaxID=2785785 RepID=UPI0018C3748F|nr:hypothetical protein [Methylomonas sp. LL1]QPK62568.1 hypothetical protein IVG45_17190 [Methylomonas sp. LL1]